MTSRCKHALIIMLMIAMAMLLLSCGSSEEDSGGGGPVTTVSVTAGSSQIVADGATGTTIRATATDSDGNMVSNGTAATFTTSAGTISNVTSTSNGVATAILTSTVNLGTATVMVDIGGVSDSTMVEFISGPPASLAVTASPANLTADGASTSAIRIVVRDANGNPVEDGETVTVTSQYGTCCMLTTSTTDGVATVTYTAPETRPASGNDRITVSTANGKTGSVTILLAGPAIATINLTADRTSLPADNESQATIRATVTMEGGGNAPDGITVNFVIVSGGGSISPQETTTAGGRAEAVLTSAAIPGSATVRASAEGVNAEIEIDYAPGSISLSIIPNAILGTSRETAVVTALLKNTNGNALPGQTVRFKLSDLTLGSFTTPSEVVTSSEGLAQVTFRDAGKGGTALITAEWGTVSGSETVTIQPPPSSIRVAAGYPDPTAISVIGSGEQTTSQITFDVVDSDGNPVVDGYRIDFYVETSPGGGEEITPLTARTEKGQVTTKLRSGFKSGPVSIKAVYYYNTNVNTTASQIAISAGPPVGEAFGITAQYLNVSGLAIALLEDPIFANAGDLYGNTIPDNTAISFKTYETGGFIGPGSDNTEGGIASSVLFSPGTGNATPVQGFVSVTAEAVGGRSTRITDLEIVDRSTVYAATNGGGIYKSLDSGVSWTNISRSSEGEKVGQNWIDPYVKALAVDPDDHNVVYAGTGYLGRGNVYRSIDGGANWNSGNPEEWCGRLSLGGAVLSVLCDGDENGGIDYPFVWVGTQGFGALYSQDGEHFQWVGKIDPLLPTVQAPWGDYINPLNAGDDGYLTKPDLNYTSRSEEWTATYCLIPATAGSPAPATTNIGTATMSAVITNPTATKTEDWTVQYDGIVNDDLLLTGTGDGTLANIVIKTARTEEWTLSCTTATPGSAVFSVTGSLSGALDPATEGVPYGSDVLDFTINHGTINFAVGDRFTFSTTTYWVVTGSESGVQNARATAGAEYTSDWGEVTFEITAGGKASAIGDKFTFSTAAAEAPYWLVEGSVSGLQINRAYTNYPYNSDGWEVRFTIVDGTRAFAAGDEFSFEVMHGGLGYGKNVRQIVKVADTHGEGAILYAGTNQGVHRSADGGATWQKMTAFTGNNINALILHPTSDGVADVLYAGTDEYGVWYSSDGGGSWEAFPTAGLGGGLSATTPVADRDNQGNGVIGNLSADSATTVSELWTVTCKDEATNGGIFTVAGTVSGEQADAEVGSGYTSDGGEISFTIFDGSYDFKKGDSFEFHTTRDGGNCVRDIAVDNSNNKLYALTYFWGSEPHAVGNIYVIDLDPADSYKPTGGWKEATVGLPQFDPPDDTTLFAQHVIAVDDRESPRYLLAGGEGINLYKAVSGLDEGTPVWLESKRGIDNRIMARMPVLFTDECIMTIDSEELTPESYIFTIFIEDRNGNPPIEGSKLEYTTYRLNPDTGDFKEVDTVTLIEYGDTLAYQGTWPDPSDLATRFPYYVYLNFDTIDRVKFIFTPTSLDVAPGSSGGVREIDFSIVKAEE